MQAHATYPSLAGRRVFITGGASGIGAAMVEAFSEQGAIVGHCDLAADAAEALAEQIAAAGHPRPWFRALDVTDTPALQAAISAFAAASGGLEVLVNNVANDTRHDPLEMDEAGWRRCIAVNLDCAFFASQRAVELMRGGGNGGAIINFSSINALLGPADMPGYATAKAGLLGLTKSLARRYGMDGIRVNAILPGWVVTPRQLALWLTPEAEAEWMEQTCLKQRIQPRDAANLALFLASDDSRMITNQHFVIDAGRV
ncbi:SDR family NAD(P)-dependent oxidoreductase [Erythrobacter tepidarius]|uniref:SDR family NAD(P)-dependent oxidoreductase n=1 Tax=Erythrobacter tepidarius TaxID=60454 RepID=UPI000A38EE33|nr:SDR family oxidoreductase [Erythrobacter tepidarius]